MSRRILIADDHVPTRRDLQAFLQQQGFEVLAVGNGDLAARRAGEMHPDLVILDVLMPGKTGYEACRHIKQVLKLELPVLMIHHDVEPFDRNEAARAGADETLVKPLDPFALLETMHALWRKYGRPLMGAESAGLGEEVQEEDVEAVFGGGPVGAPLPADAPLKEQEAVTPPAEEQPVPADQPHPSLDSSVPGAADLAADLAAADASMTSVEESKPTAPPEAAYRTPTIELDDPYSVVASGDYATYFREEPSKHAEQAVPEPDREAAQVGTGPIPAPEVFPATPPDETETLIRQDIPFTDPYPSRNIFAPIPTQDADISFSVPERITSELPPPDPSAGLSIHFDPRNAAVHIGGLYEVTEVELPEHATQELPPAPAGPESAMETLDEADVSSDGLPTEELPAAEVALLQETGTDILASAVIVAVTSPTTGNTPTVSTLACPHCGGQVLESDILCPHCGEML
ncbi:response regulator [Chloracidobacterium sp. MS 40/45]|uniref:response regulator n=1 Tax=Chloracidobacterium aggregatum TaxID=2851959 RepID=UPI001B8D61A4|nr:response regulator [Chloracidobacterium aggregatum]QUV99081.1 response regulator [Chloracidobacterium sp. MS 40/45]